MTSPTTPPPSPGFAEYVGRLFGRTGARTDGPPIQVRRFAGPVAHVEKLDELRVAHVTDLHFGRVTPMAVQHRAVDLINAEEPDLVVMTGDFVCHSQLYLDSLREVMSKLRAPAYAVLGNHDHWSGGAEVARALRKAGVEVLENQHTVLTLRHQRIQIVGVDDAYTGHCDIHKAVRGLRKDLPSIGLSHIGEEADALWAKGVPLVVSGHTHAGQVTLAGLHELTLGRLAGHKYVHGLYGSRHGGEDPRRQPQGAVYVGAGIGASVLPFRVGERGQREVAVFELGTHPEHVDEHHAEQPPHKGRKPSPRTQYKRHSKVLLKKMKRDKRGS